YANPEMGGKLSDVGVRSVPPAFDAHVIDAARLPSGQSLDSVSTFMSKPGKYGDAVESFAPVKAKQVQEPFRLDDGTEVNAGDYLARDQHDLTYVVPRETFESSFVPQGVHDSIV